MDDRGGFRWADALTVVSLIAAGLFYLQFGLQALVHHVPQATLSLVGAAALGWGTVRKLRGKAASLVVLLGTLPVLVLHAVMTLEDPGELPFLLGSIPVPLIATVALTSDRRR